MRAHFFVGAAIAGLAAGCGSSPSSSGPTYYRDVKPLVEARCVGCHNSTGIAPFPLTTFEEVSRARGLMKREVQARSMPPWSAGPGCAEYANDRSLSDAEIAVLASWADGEPALGQPDDFRPLASASTLPVLSRVDVTLSPPAPYTPQPPFGETDDYRCFLLDWTADSDQYLTGFGVKPQNERILHHLVAFAIPEDKVPHFQDVDAADPGLGYGCFGGPGGGGGSLIEGYLGVKTIGAWGPGVAPSDIVGGAGIKLGKGTRLVIQTHYSNVNAPNTPDQPQVFLKLDRSVAIEGQGMPITSPEWVLSPKSMLVPANQADVVHTADIDPAQLLSVIDAGVIPPGEPMLVHTVSYHQHLLGTHGRVEIVRADGTRECLVDMRKWDFHWQMSYELSKPKIVNPGDTIRLECHWDNSAANQPLIGGERHAPRDVVFGEKTTDEMCVGGLFLTRAN